MAPSKISVYRYDNEEFADGLLIESRGDSFSALTEDEKKVELAIRATLPDGENIRSTSLYTWADEELAKRLWSLSGKRYLYELEIDEADIRHKGDLNYYSEAKTAAKLGTQSRASRRAMARPMPLEPPVMNIVFPLRLIDFSPIRGRR